MAAENFIVAIELGSSKVIGIAGKKNLDGSIKVLAVVKEESSSFIRRGVVYNIDKTVQCITNIVGKLKSQLKTEISKVYVGEGGQSIQSIKNILSRDLNAETKVTQAMVDNLMDTNRNMQYADKEILDAATQEYQVDTQLQLDPIGIQCTHLEGHFLNILQRKSFYKTLNTCFDMAGIKIAELYLAPIALADSILTEAEKRSGCAMIDIGAETTTVAVYSKNILRHLAVIPLGGKNITKDIMSLQMEEEEAEKMKIKYGSAYTDSNDIDESLKYPIDSDRQVDSSLFINVVESRVEEIISNASYQIPQEFFDKLLGGIILTGGCCNMKNMEKAVRNIFKIEKVRTAKFVNHTIISNNSYVNAKDGMMNTVLGMLIKGDINCSGGEMKAEDEITEKNDANAVKGPRKISDIPVGVVITEAEKQMAAEELLRKQEEENKLAKEKEIEEARQREEELRKKKENSLVNKSLKWMKSFANKILEEEK